MPKKVVEPEVKLIELTCSVCQKKFSIPIEEHKHYIEDGSLAYFGQYVLRAGQMAALQVGDLCSNCAKKDLKDRIYKKF